MKKLKPVLFLITIVLGIVFYSPLSNNCLAAEQVAEGYETIAETNNLLMYFNNELNSVIVKDKRNGYLWKSTVDDELFDTSSTSQQIRNSMSSLFVIEYQEFGLKSANIAVRKAFSSVEPQVLTYEVKDNGILLNYQFTSIDIGLTLEILLSNDSLIIRIPDASITESGKFGIVRIEITPFMGASHSGMDGYILYPDGPGALMYYKSVNNRPQNTRNSTWYVYGFERSSIFMDQSPELINQNLAMMPIYGIKNGDNALLAAATSSEGNAMISLAPEGYIVDLNRISFTFTYRYYSELLVSEVTAGGEAIKKVSSYRLVDSRSLINPEVTYFFIAGDEADYSGMANIYRKYLLSNEKLSMSLDEDTKIPLSIDYFMGITEKRLLFKHFVKMTTFEQAKDITEIILDKGVENIQLKFIGWTDGGYGNFPDTWPPDRRLGGSGGFKILDDFASENDIILFAQTNIIEANSGNSGFSKRNDVVYSANRYAVTDSTRSKFLMNPFSALRIFLNLMKHVFRSDNWGVGMDVIGKYTYNDFNRRNTAEVDDTIAKWSEMMEETVSMDRSLAVERGNLYTLKYADRLYDVPVESSKRYIEDESVPFFQMLVHGRIDYSSTPANLFFDYARQKLKWIEFGCIPHFVLTYKSPSNLRNSEYNRLFSSYYLNWIDEAVGIYQEFNESLISTRGQEMIRHEKIKENIYKITYGNGISVYINYSENDEVVGNDIVKALDYLVVEQGGKTQ